MERKLGELGSLEGLRVLRDDFSDEVPSQRIHSLSSDGKQKTPKEFKVARNWWCSLIGCLENALEEGLIPDSSVQEQVREFSEHYISEEFYNQPLTTAEEIAEANRIINLVLGENSS